MRGWLEANEEQLEQIKEIIVSNLDNNPYWKSWVLPQRGGGYVRFIFFGHTVKEGALPCVREQIKRIATTVVSIDGDLEDYVEGIFHINAEDGKYHFIWSCEDGKWSESQL